MKGKIVSYRRGKTTQHPNQILVKIKDVLNKESAKNFIGKKVKWLTKTKKEFTGSISRTHGNKGLVRARFNKGIPGQAINEEVEIK